ncbi:hypothetical protein BST38_15595 [Mycolicibacterium parafortuitum]|nr:hypothetical protein BST38_15595 [Mycolicibacterium parafortuitum]
MSDGYERDDPVVVLTDTRGYKIYTLNNAVTLAGSHWVSVSPIDAVNFTVQGAPNIAFDAAAVAMLRDSQGRETLYLTDPSRDMALIVAPESGNARELQLPPGSTPGDIVASPDGKRVYIANRGYPDFVSPSIAVIDPGSTNVSQIPLEFRPDKLFVTADSKRLVALHSNGSIAVIDTASRQVSKILQGPSVGLWDRVVMSGNGRLYFTSISELGVVDTVDTSSGSSSKITLPSGSFQISLLALSPKGDRLFTYAMDGTLSVIDTASRKVLGSDRTPGSVDWALGGAMMRGNLTVSPDGRRVYVLSPGVGQPPITGALATFDVTKNKFIGEPLPVGHLATSVAVSADSSRVYVASMTADGSHAVYVIDSGKPLLQKAIQAPASTADLYNRLRDLTDWPQGKDGVAIDAVKSKADGKMRLIVYLGGTQLDEGATRGTLRNVPLYFEGDADTSGIIEKIDRALKTLPQGTEIMLVGFSQGGMDAQAVESDWKHGAHRGSVTTVVTFASPMILPPGANEDHVIFLREDSDSVPMLTDWLNFLNVQDHNGKWRQAGQVFEFDSGIDYPLIEDPLGLKAHGDRRTYSMVATAFDKSKAPEYAVVKADLARFRGDIVNYWQY